MRLMVRGRSVLCEAEIGNIVVSLFNISGRVIMSTAKTWCLNHGMFYMVSNIVLNLMLTL